MIFQEDAELDRRKSNKEESDGWSSGFATDDSDCQDSKPEGPMNLIGDCGPSASSPGPTAGKLKLIEGHESGNDKGHRIPLIGEIAADDKSSDDDECKEPKGTSSANEVDYLTFEDVDMSLPHHQPTDAHVDRSKWVGWSDDGSALSDNESEGERNVDSDEATPLSADLHTRSAGEEANVGDVHCGQAVAGSHAGALSDRGLHGGAGFMSSWWCASGWCRSSVLQSFDFTE